MDDEIAARLMPGQTLAAARRAMAGMFRDGGLPTPDLDARFLFAAVFASGALDAAIDASQAARLAQMARRRLDGVPVDRILGNREFWSLTFDLDPHTLAPRPDTETLVEAALAILKASGTARPRILDLGTGSGAILIAVLSEWAAATGLGIDRSPGALVVARRNAVRNGVGTRALFVAGYWMQALAGCFDLVISNPPYIPTGVLAGLAREVRDHDPRLALDGGTDGLDAYREIAAGLGRVLAPGGHVVLEIGAGQQGDVTAIMADAGFAPETARQDLGGHVRALVFRR